MTASSTIPKVIHYCWFGRNPMPLEFQKNIETWKKYCPDYELKLWTEDNYDVHKNEYISQAYDNGKWAFVSDYARLDVVSENGGVYLDVDVELVHSLDSLMNQPIFLALESAGEVNTGLGFGAIPHHPFIEANKQVYESRFFMKENGKLDLTTCVQITSKLLLDKGMQKVDENQRIDGIQIYASDYFAPFQLATQKLQLTDRTIGIHQYSASWKHQNKLVHWLWQKTLPLKFKLRHLLGDEFYNRVRDILKK